MRRVGGTLDQSACFQLTYRQRDVTAIEFCASTDVCLTERPSIADGCEYPELVTGEAYRLKTLVKDLM